MTKINYIGIVAIVLSVFLFSYWIHKKEARLGYQKYLSTNPYYDSVETDCKWIFRGNENE